jgi:hypothetical protein
MRVIAVLTALFLPFTFMAVSQLLSLCLANKLIRQILLTTPIFKWPDPPEGQVVVKLPFVIYWAVSFVLTLAVGSVMWRFTSEGSGSFLKKLFSFGRVRPRWEPFGGSAV